MSFEDCPFTYFGQTKCLVSTRIKKHLKEAELVKCGSKKYINSAVTRPIVQDDYKIEKVTVLKEVTHKKLDPY